MSSGRSNTPAICNWCLYTLCNKAAFIIHAKRVQSANMYSMLMLNFAAAISASFLPHDAMLSAIYAVFVCLSVCMSVCVCMCVCVCLSHRYCIKTAKSRITHYDTEQKNGKVSKKWKQKSIAQPQTRSG